MRNHKILLCFTVLILCFSACRRPLASDQPRVLTGEWDYVACSSRHLIFESDFTLREDSSLVFHETYDTFEMIQDAGGGYKLHSQENENDIGLEFTEKTIKLKFDDKYCIYVKQSEENAQTEGSPGKKVDFPSQSGIGPSHKAISPANLDELASLRLIGEGYINDFGYIGENKLVVGTSVGLFFYELPGFKLIRYIETSSEVSFLRVSKSQKMVVFVNEGDFLKVWDEEKEMLVFDQPAPQYAVVEAWFDLAEKNLIVRGYKAISIVDLTTGELVQETQIPGKALSVVWDPVYSTIAILLDIQLVLQYQLVGLVSRNEILSKSEVDMIAYSPDGEFLITASSGSCLIWDAKTSTLAAEIKVPGDSKPSFDQIEFSESNDFAILSGETNDLYKLTGYPEQSIVLLNSWPMGEFEYCLSPSGSTFVVLSNTGFEMWDVATNHIISNSSLVAVVNSSAIISQDGTLIAMNQNDEIAVLDLTGGGGIKVIPISTLTYQPILQFTNDGLKVILDDDDQLIFMNLLTGETSPSVKFPNHGMGKVSSDGAFFSTAVAHGVRLWSMKDGSIIEELKGETLAEIGMVEFSPDGKYIAAADGSGTIIVWDIKSAKIVLSIPKAVSISEAFAFSHDSRQILINQGQSVEVWEIATKELTQRIATSMDRIISLAISPDGRLIALGDSERGIHLIEVSNPNNRISLKNHKNGIVALKFAENGETLISVSYDGTARVWGIP